MPVPSQCYYRTYRIQTPVGGGSGFIINHHDRQWLVTAEHVVKGIADDDVKIVTRDGVARHGLEKIPANNPGADVAVYSLGGFKLVPDKLTLHATAKELMFTQDVYFMGYPYGLAMDLDNLPLVKKAIVSGSTNQNGVDVWLLDGINNEGFSGGPIVFQRGYTQEWHVMGIVSGYLTEHVAVGTAGTVPTNTGLIIGYDIKHALDAIEDFMNPKSLTTSLTATLANPAANQTN